MRMIVWVYNTYNARVELGMLLLFYKTKWEIGLTNNEQRSLIISLISRN